jgi:hypothetical protein
LTALFVGGTTIAILCGSLIGAILWPIYRYRNTMAAVRDPRLMTKFSCVRFAFVVAAAHLIALYLLASWMLS